MKINRLVPVLAAASALLLCSVAHAATFNPRKIKKWPDEDKVWARALDAWMSQEEMDIFIGIKTTDERKSFLKEAGYWKFWEEVDDEMMPNVHKGDVVVGMNKDEVFMCWDKPVKIRKDFKRAAYVDVLNYEFERDRKGREFLLRPDSQTAYKNEVFTRYVYMYNGLVFSIVEAGDEESAMDDLPVEDKKEAAPPAEEPADDEAGETGEAEATEETESSESNE